MKTFLTTELTQDQAGNYMDLWYKLFEDCEKYMFCNVIPSIIPKDYFRLREVSLSYSFPKSMLAKTPFQQVSLALVGRNLLLFTPKENNYVDPEVSNLGNDLLSEFGETTGTSSTRNIGVNVKVVF